jgi:hypothetical protein
MERYVFRFRGPAAPSDQSAAIKKRAKVVDSSPKQLLVEGDPSEIDQLATDFPQWTVSKEVRYKIPEEPLRVRKPPEE